MKKGKLGLLAVLVVSVAALAQAELQNVEVGGVIRIRGNYFHFDDVKGADVQSPAFVDQRTRLNVKADFTDNVSAYFEVDSYDVWGEDFRSASYLTGVDNRAASGNDVEIYQSYIDVSEIGGTPLHARIGRQEWKFGSGWLVGTNDTAPYSRGLSFDALLLSYATDTFSVAAVGGKLQERSSIERDGDIDVYGVYTSYLGIENTTLDAYWLYIRDAENFRGGLDAHVFGLRGAGRAGAFDYEAELAYQFLDWDTKNALRAGNQTSSDAIGANALAGYTFDGAYAPRIYLGGAYFEGDDKDIAFNRLFSDWKYSLLLDTQANLSNIWLLHGGISVSPTETLKLTASLGYIQTIEDTITRNFLFWHENSDKPLGYELGVRADYAYTQDLSFALGYSHLFAQDGLRDGNLVPNNGSAPAFSDDADYVYAETGLKF